MLCNLQREFQFFLFCTHTTGLQLSASPASRKHKSNAIVRKPRIETGPRQTGYCVSPWTASKQQLHIKLASNSVTFVFHFLSKRLSLLNRLFIRAHLPPIYTLNAMCKHMLLCVKARDQLSLVCHSLQGSGLTLLHPLLWLFSALTCSSCPAFSCLVSAAPASTRRQLALRTRQIPADGGPRGRHAKYSKILSVSDRQQNSDGRAAEMQNTPRYFRQAIEY